MAEQEDKGKQGSDLPSNTLKDKNTAQTTAQGPMQQKNRQGTKPQKTMALAPGRGKAVSRRDFLHTSAATGAALVPATALFTQGCGSDYSQNPDKPNIVFITADDLGWKDLSCYGNEDVQTPNIDRLAREGMQFGRAFVVSSSCAPSRASFITGQYPHTNGVTGLTHIHKMRSLSPFHTTLPGLLSDAGYHTALQGKWHVSPYLPTSWYGYDERLSGMFPEDFWIKDMAKPLDFIRQNKDNRFYLELNFMNNHRDGYGEFSFAKGFPVDPDKVKVPDYCTLPQWPEIKEEVAKYHSQTMKMDAMIGEVLDSLDKLDLSDNTMVVFVSDNGPPFPGNKMTLYDRGIAVPLLVRWPNKIKSGKSDTMISSIDIAPTILQAAGVRVDQSIEGRSFLAHLTREGEYHERKAIYAEMTDHVLYVPMRAVRTERFKYIKNYSDSAVGLDQNLHMDWAHRLVELSQQPWTSPRVPEELYDLKKDPHEQNNLVQHDKVLDKNYQEDLERMRRLLKEHMKRTNDPYLGHEFTHDYDPARHKKREPGKKYK